MLTTQSSASHSHSHIHVVSDVIVHAQMHDNHGNGENMIRHDGVIGHDDVQEDQVEEQEDLPEVDITISNVVCNFSVHCHLNLRTVASKGSNVEYNRAQQLITMKLRVPRVTARIYSSGKITCTGATTEDQAKCGARRVARILQKMGFRVRFGGYRVNNVLGSCSLPFGIKIHEFSDNHRRVALYEPELHPGATFRMTELGAVLKIYQTGSLTIMAPSVSNVQLAVERIYPLVHDYRKPKPKSKTKPESSNPSRSFKRKGSEKNKSKKKNKNYIDDDESDLSEMDQLIDDEDGDDHLNSEEDEDLDEIQHNYNSDNDSDQSE